MAALSSPSEAPVRVVLGTMTFAGQTDKDSAMQMIRAFADSPLSKAAPELDSARMYGGGKTEELIGELMAENAEDFSACALATKANPFMDNTLTAEGTTAQLDATLGALKTNAVDVFYLHAPDAAVAIEETLQAVHAYWPSDADSTLHGRHSTPQPKRHSAPPELVHLSMPSQLHLKQPHRHH